MRKKKNTKILLDTNILLDYFLGREPHFTNADRIMMLCRKHEISACIAGHSILNMYFILRKDMSDEVRRIQVKVITPEEFLRLKGGEDDCF